MNKVQLIGRPTRDPEVRYSPQKEDGLSTCIASFALAVNRNHKKDEADFINIKAFGKAGELCEKYVRKGKQIAVCGRIQTGSYTNKDEVKIYTTEVIMESLEFLEKKSDGSSRDGDDGFMNIPDGIDENLPFS